MLRKRLRGNCTVCIKPAGSSGAPCYLDKFVIQLSLLLVGCAAKTFFLAALLSKVLLLHDNVGVSAGLITSSAAFTIGRSVDCREYNRAWACSVSTDVNIKGKATRLTLYLLIVSCTHKILWKAAFLLHVNTNKRARTKFKRRVSKVSWGTNISKTSCWVT